jgi:hypothetical protein
VYQWSSLLSDGATLSTKFLIYFIYLGLVATAAGGRGSFDLFFAILLWSLQALENGKWPEVDHLGNPIPGGGGDLANGYYAVLFLLKGDLAYVAHRLKLAPWNTDERCFRYVCLSNNKTHQPKQLQAFSRCALCRANTSGVGWTSIGPGAPWMPTIWNPTTWRLAFTGCMLLLRMPGLTGVSFYPDWMHCKHIGTDMYFLGSILTYLTHHFLTGSPQDNLQILWQRVVQAYQALIKVYR